MAEIVSAVDRWGRQIVLRQERWTAHVLVEHPELADYTDAVREVIADPDLVTVDPSFGRRECFYRLGRGSRFGRVYLKVVVQFRPTPPDGTWVGEVVTAFFIPRAKRGETQKWP